MRRCRAAQGWPAHQVRPEPSVLCLPFRAACAGYWLQALGAALPACSTFFINYIILSALASNLSRFLWPHMGARAGAGRRASGQAGGRAGGRAPVVHRWRC